MRDWFVGRDRSSPQEARCGHLRAPSAWFPGRLRSEYYLAQSWILTPAAIDDLIQAETEVG